MVGMESDKTVREGTKRYMIADINSRKDCIKNMTYSSCKFLTPVLYTVGVLTTFEIENMDFNVRVARANGIFLEW